MLEGKVGFRFADREETYEAGDAYYVAARPHAGPLRGGGDRRVQPDGVLGETIPVVMKNLQRGRSRRGSRAMNYRLAYAIGFHPWEDLAEHPPFADKLLELVAREEDGHGPPVRTGARPRHRQRGLGRASSRSAAGR